MPKNPPAELASLISQVLVRLDTHYRRTHYFELWRRGGGSIWYPVNEVERVDVLQWDTIEEGTEIMEYILWEGVT